MTAADFDLLTIGHSNLPVERFVELLAGAGVTAIVDVRSVPFSRRFPWFTGKRLAERLAQSSIGYLPMATRSAAVRTIRRSPARRRRL